jgi:tRNA pseudouridine38-40 synthase
MNKFKAVVEYDGTAYHGWQLQKDVPTIQGEMEKALERILGTPTRVHGSGRTDAGVHAVGQVAHFISNWSHPTEELCRACNALLPEDITVRSLEHAAEDFHARHSTHSKTYVYRILNLPLRSPLLRLYSWHIPYPLDSNSMEAAAAHLVGTHDFAAFGAPTEGTPSTVREVLQVAWDRDEVGGVVQFTICATGFLRYMVRCLVGTLVLVGRKKITPEDFLEILKSRERSKSGPSAPPQGLCLKSVQYDKTTTGRS